MNILENEIEDIIFNALGDQLPELRKRGFWAYKNHTYLRQVDIGAYGRVDIVGFNFTKKTHGSRTFHFHIIEIKKDQISLSTLNQAVRYCAGFKRLVAENTTNAECVFTISLVGKSIDMANDFVFFTDVFQDVVFYTYSIDLMQGILFRKVEDFIKKNESLPKSEKFSDLVLDKLRQVMGVEIKLPQLPF